MTATTTATRSKAEIATEHASRYLQQLCKHFAHKREVSFTPTEGKINFTAGDCLLAADDTTLTLTAVANSAAELPQLEDVVARHLVRFAFREELKIDWRPEAS
jgi:hypothetical protein